MNQKLLFINLLSPHSLPTCYHRTLYQRKYLSKSVIVLLLFLNKCKQHVNDVKAAYVLLVYFKNSITLHGICRSLGSTKFVSFISICFAVWRQCFAPLPCACPYLLLYRLCVCMYVCTSYECMYVCMYGSDGWWWKGWVVRASRGPVVLQTGALK